VSAAPDSENRYTPLVPTLSAWTALAIVVGAVIGSGIFIKPRDIATQLEGHLGLIVTLWVVCGIVNLCGALSLAELACMHPRAGGTYIYLREAYGKLAAFLWGWAELWVIRSGSIAAMAAGMMISMRFIMLGLTEEPLSPQAEALGAALVIGLLGTINAIGTRLGGRVQEATTYFKIAFVAILAALPLLALGREPVAQPSAFPDPSVLSTSGFWTALGISLFAVMWTYDGWGNLGVVAEDLHKPERSIPTALIGGVLLLTVLYTLVNIAYHLTWPWQSIAASPAPGVEVGAVLLSYLGLTPRVGTIIMNGVLLVSVFGALNANLLAGPRVLLAMARDRVFLSPFAKIHPTLGTPWVAILGLTLWSMCLVGLATLLLANQSWLPESWRFENQNALFDRLVEFCIFGGSLFYLMSVVAVFVLRWKYPDARRPYRTWGYPVTPLLFIVFYVLLLGNLAWSAPGASLAGLAFIASGLIVFPWRARHVKLPPGV
jgi:APA family basic amino acid/polyamine antiporter